MATLYEIDQAIMACIDFETGEIIDSDMLDALQMERTKKIENVALWIKNLMSDAVAFKVEKEAFEAREKAARNKAESLIKWLTTALEGQKFSTNRCAVTFRNSTVVKIEDEALIPKQYMNEKITYAPNKTAIKKAIESGEIISGCALVGKCNPTIK